MHSVSKPCNEAGLITTCLDYLARKKPVVFVATPSEDSQAFLSRLMTQESELHVVRGQTARNSTIYYVIRPGIAEETVKGLRQLLGSNLIVNVGVPSHFCRDCLLIGDPA
jgi:hypothetical protein